MYSTSEPSLGVKHCAQCGAVFTPARNHSDQAYCSKRCSDKFNYEHGVNAVVFVCQNCGKEYHPKQSSRSTFCSRECSYAWLAAHPRPRKAKPEPKPKPKCEVCGEPCRYTTAKTCSIECRRIKAAREWQEYARRTTVKAKRNCKYCGVLFVPEYGNKSHWYCCPEHARKAARKNERIKYGKSFGSRAKAILRQYYGDRWSDHYERINRQKIFERDRWTCAICGKNINKRLRSPHPRSASIDHIIPLSQGGEHKYENCQAAHLYCNSIKSDRGGAQLRIFGL